MKLYPITIANSILIFLLSGFIGWIFLSFFNQKWNGYFWENYSIPFKPMFALGGLLIYLLVPLISKYNFFVQFVLYALILTFWEWMAFWIADNFFGVRFRCYYNGKRLALLYSIYWGLLGVILGSVFQGKFPLIVFMILLVLVCLLNDGRQGQFVLDRDPRNVKLC